jgi:hypothetical protein
LVDAVPHGHWRTEAFIGTLRCDGLDRYCSFEAAIKRRDIPRRQRTDYCPEAQILRHPYCRQPVFTAGVREAIEGGRKPAFICAYIRNVDFRMAAIPARVKVL